jgi:hypothetical protein
VAAAATKAMYGFRMTEPPLAVTVWEVVKRREKQHKGDDLSPGRSRIGSPYDWSVNLS